jgi:hypothetical protein
VTTRIPNGTLVTLDDGSTATRTPTALETYERWAGVAQLGWSTLAADLRAEAELHTGGQRTKRLDRALDCETKALAQRTAAAFRGEVAVTIHVSLELGLPGHWSNAWRINTPGHGFAQDRIGDSYSQFVALWCGVAIAVREWDRRGRPLPAFATPEQKAVR